MRRPCERWPGHPDSGCTGLRRRTSGPEVRHRTAGPNHVGRARRFQRQGRRQAVAELRGVGRHGLTAVAGVGRRVDHAAEVRQSRRRVQIVERLRHAEGEAGQLDEGAVAVERAVARLTLRAATDCDVAAQGAELGLRAGISRDVTARLPVPAVVARPGVDIARTQRTVGQVVVGVDTQVLADPTADLEAGIGTRDVIEPRTVQTANLHVLDGLRDWRAKRSITATLLRKHRVSSPIRLSATAGDAVGAAEN